MSDIEEIKSRLDIAEVIGQYVPGLKRAGRSFKGPCPFHQEKTPSFVVTPDMQIFKCFGCGEGGDVISFIQKIERVEFGEALKIAAEKAGYQLKDQRQSDSQLESQKQRIYEANQLAAKFWNYILKTHKTGKIGRDYVAKRAIRIEEIDKFIIGYAPDSNDNLLKFLENKGFTSKELLSFGLATEQKGKIRDKFRDRLMMPILDLRGNVVAFSGRKIKPSDYAPKYLNSPETIVYHKGETLIALYQAKQAARAADVLILVEGNIDPLSSHKVGVENIAATGGTALTEAQCKLIKRFASTVYFGFDTDQAGIKALLRGIEIAERIGLRHKVLDIKEYKDPDELISQAPGEWEPTITAAKNSVDYLLQLYQKDLDLGSAEGKRDYLERAITLLKLVKDQVQVNHSLNQVAVVSGLTQEQVLERLSGDQQIPIAKSTQSKENPTPDSSGINAREVYLLALLLVSRDFEIDPDVFSDVNCRELYTQISLSSDPKLIARDLSNGAQEVLIQVLSIDTQNIENTKEELTRIYRQLRDSQLTRQILDLRKKLQADTDSQDLLVKLLELTAKKRALTE